MLLFLILPAYVYLLFFFFFYIFSLFQFGKFTFFLQLIEKVISFSPIVIFCFLVFFGLKGLLNVLLSIDHYSNCYNYFFLKNKMALDSSSLWSMDF